MMNRKVLQIGASVVMIGGVLIWLMKDTMSEQIEYFHPVDVVIVKSSELAGQKMRVGGYVEKGSILQKKGTLEYIFSVRPVEGMMKHPEAAGKTLEVRYTGVMPDTFKDDAEVVASGTLGHDGIFHATEVLAKCPSKYEAESKNKGTY